MQQQNPQKVEASKVPEYIKKAAKKAAEFNSNFNRERMEERRAYFDLQTHVSSTLEKLILFSDVLRDKNWPLCTAGCTLGNTAESLDNVFGVFSQIIQVPQGRFKVLAPELTKTGPYPVALIPGQFQEYYKRYVRNFDICCCVYPLCYLFLSTVCTGSYLVFPLLC